MKNKHYFKALLFLLALFCCQGMAQAQWTPVGPEGGYVKCMTKSGNNIYAVTGFLWFASPGFYCSEDNGVSWNSVNSSSLPGDIRAITTLGNSLFIGTGSGIYRSDDNGLTWIVKNNGFPQGDKWINHLAVSGTTIFAAGTNEGIIRSTDNGEHWTVANSGLTDTYLYSLTANDNAIFAGTGDQMLGVFRSTDNGNTWQQVKNGMGYYDNGQWVYSYAPMITAMGFVGTVLYAGTSEFQGIWKSLDNGDNWVFTSMETMNYYEFNAFSGDESAILAGTRDGGGVIRSVNNGLSWSEANDGIGNHGQVTSFLNKDGSTFVGTKGGIYKTVDSGVSWSTSCSGIYSQSVTSPAFAVIGSEIFVGTGHGGVFKSQDGGNSWIESNNGLPISEWDMNNLASTSSALFAGIRVSMDAGNSWQVSNSPGWSSAANVYGPRWLEFNSAFYAVGSAANPGLYRSINNSATWSQLSNGLPDPSTTIFNQISSDGTNLYLSTGGGVYYSSDNGNNWNLSTFNPPVGFGINTYAGAAYNAGNSTLIRTPGGLYKSTDHGISWDMLHFWAPITDYLVSYGTIYKTGNIIYSLGEYSYWDNEVGRVYVNNYYMSEDEGITWTNITQNFSTIMHGSSFVYEGSNIYIIAKSSNNWNIYRSSDQGTNWVNVSQNFPNALMSQLFIFNDKIFAGTNGRSVWTRNLSEFTTPVQPGAISGKETPCSGSTEIYSVENVAGVTYHWQFPQDWIITSGNETNSITVNVGNTSGLVLVIPSNEFGIGQAQFKLVTPVAAIPTPAITFVNNALFSTAPTGNQWYLNGEHIEGAVNQTLIPIENGDYTVVVNIGVDA